MLCADVEAEIHDGLGRDEDEEKLPEIHPEAQQHEVTGEEHAHHEAEHDVQIAAAGEKHAVEREIRDDCRRHEAGKHDPLHLAEPQPQHHKHQHRQRDDTHEGDQDDGMMAAVARAWLGSGLPRIMLVEQVINRDAEDLAHALEHRRVGDGLAALPLGDRLVRIIQLFAKLGLRHARGRAQADQVAGEDEFQFVHGGDLSMVLSCLFYALTRGLSTVTRARRSPRPCARRSARR